MIAQKNIFLLFCLLGVLNLWAQNPMLTTVRNKANFNRKFLKEDSPSIIILYADDLGYGDLSIQNSESKIQTPNIDKLASEGIRFTDAHSSSALCTPSRYALLTGRYHWRKFHGISDEFGASKFDKERLTLPEMLQSKGYYTAAIGKWHLGMGWEAIKNKKVEKVEVLGKQAYPVEAFRWSEKIPDGPTAHGFDSYFGEDVINFPPYTWIENDKVVQVPNKMHSTNDDWRRSKLDNRRSNFCRPGPMVSGWDPYKVLPTLTGRAVSFIQSRKNKKEPFFLYMAFPSPHVPIVPNDEFDGTSQAGPYGDFVVETDYACGKILNAVLESGLDENTLVIFTSDNGPENIAYERDFTYNHWSSRPFRGLKRDIYEGGHHVPFIVKWPKYIKGGMVSIALVSQIDIMATLAEIVGYELPGDQAEDSYSFLPILKGKKEICRESIVYNTFENEYAIRQGDWVLVNANCTPKKKDNKEWCKKHGYTNVDRIPNELYNLSSDIGQYNNLSLKYPEKVKELLKLLEDIQTKDYSSPRITNYQQ